MHVITAAVFSLFLLSCSASMSGLKTRLTSQHETCFGYEASRSSHETAIRVFVHYRMTSLDGRPNGAMVTAAVRGPAMVKMSDAALHITGKEDQFTFNAVMSGLHRVCFMLQSSGGGDVELELDIVGQNDPMSRTTMFGGSEVFHHVRLEKGSSSNYVDMVESLQTHVEVAASEFNYLHGARDDFEHTVQSTYVRVITFTLINVVVAIAVCAWQVLTLKQFFVAKKIV